MTIAPRALALRGVHLAALSAFALAQPLFDVLADAPQFFVVRESTRFDVIAFAVGLTLIPPALLLAVEVAVAAVSSRVASALHLVFVGALSALFAMQALKKAADPSAGVAFGAAVIVGVLAALAYWRAAPLRFFLTVLAPAPLVYLALFLADTPTAALSVTSEAHATATPARSNTPVVMVVFDELPTTSLMNERRTIDARRFPGFAALAADATWFRNATTLHEHTTEAVPAILTGKRTRAGRLPVLSHHPDNLFTLLADSYRFHVFEPVTQLCPQDVCPRHREAFGARMETLLSDLGLVYLHVVLPTEMTRELPSVTQTWEAFADDHGGDDATHRKRVFVADRRGVDRLVGRELWRDQRAVVTRFLAGIKPTRRPALSFLHVMLPHSPWRFLPSGAQYGNALGTNGLTIDTWTTDEWLVIQGWQRHLLQVGFTDAVLGELLKRLRAAGLYDRSLIIVTADHGASFVPGGHRRAVMPENIHDVASVPLLIKRPGQSQSRIDDRVVRSIDILPTIADVLDVRVGWKAAGRSLFAGGYPGVGRITVGGRGGERQVTVDATELVRRKYETLRRKTALFGSGAIGRVFSIGPHRELLGKPVTAARVVAVAAPRAELDGESLLNAVDPSSALSPSHVTGRLVGARSRRLDLAVAVNGRIAAVTRTFRVGGLTKFAALVPEAAFRRGANDVSVFAVASRSGTLELRRLPRTGGENAAYRLSDEGRREVIESATGRIPVVRGPRVGRVEDWFFERDSVRFGGWAGDTALGRLPDRVLVFSGERAIYAGATWVERPDITRRYPRLKRAGFVFELPTELTGNAGGSRLRFFAVVDGVARELSYHPRFPWR